MSTLSDAVPLLLPDTKRRNVRKGLITGRPLSSCERCKKRKIKCNSIRPECERCLKAGAQCIYSTGIQDLGARASQRPSKGKTPRSGPLGATPLEHGQQLAMAPPGPIDWIAPSFSGNDFDSNIPPLSPQTFLHAPHYELPPSTQPFPISPSHGAAFYPTVYDTGYAALQDPLLWTSDPRIPVASSSTAPQTTWALQPGASTHSTIDHARSTTPPFSWMPPDAFPTDPDPVPLGHRRSTMMGVDDRFKMAPVTIASDRMDPRRDQSGDRVMLPLLATRKVEGSQEEIATVVIRPRAVGDWTRIALMCA